MMSMQVDDTRPAALANQFTDDSQVEKFEMDDETYAKRTGESIRSLSCFSIKLNRVPARMRKSLSLCPSLLLFPPISLTQIPFWHTSSE